MRMGWGGWLAFVFAICALCAGAILLAIQAPMQQMRDSDAFVADIYKFIPDAPTRDDYRKASAAFFEMRRAQDTGKNALFDLGSGLVSIGVFALLTTALLAFSASVRRFVTRTHGMLVVLGVSFLLATMMSAFVTLGLIADFDRFEFPPWADSLGIAFAGIVPLGIATFVFFAVIAGAPHLKKRLPGVPFAAMRSPVRIGTIVAWAIYGLLAAGCLLLAIMAVREPVGWLLSPTMVIAAWLMLHARAVTAE